MKRKASIPEARELEERELEAVHKMASVRDEAFAVIEDMLLKAYREGIAAENARVVAGLAAELAKPEEQGGWSRHGKSCLEQILKAIRREP